MNIKILKVHKSVEHGVGWTHEMLLEVDGIKVWVQDDSGESSVRASHKISKGLAEIILEKFMFGTSTFPFPCDGFSIIQYTPEIAANKRSWEEGYKLPHDII